MPAKTPDGVDATDIKKTGETPPSSPRKMILNIDNLQKLQRIDDSSKLSWLEMGRRFVQNDLYTEFDRQILQLKPNDCAIVQKFAQTVTIPTPDHPRLSQFTLSTLYSDHPLREFHRRSVKKMNDNTDVVGLQKAQDQIAKIEELPLMVFIHGLGGQMSQFEPILQEFRNCSDIFAADLPGFGNSKPHLADPGFSRLSSYTEAEEMALQETLSGMTSADFTSDSVAELLSHVILAKFPKRNFVIVSHSMGTHIAIKLINKLPAGRVESLCLLAPPKLSTHRGAHVRLPLVTNGFLSACSLCPRMFDFYRLLDRSGGFYSKSVDMYIYPEENDLLKRLTQLRWNLDTNSEVFLKYVQGFTPATAEELLSAVSKISHSQDQKRPRVLVCCGDKDRVTAPQISKDIQETILAGGYGAKLEVIKDANHSLFLDRPHLLSGLLYEYVVGLDLNINCTWVLQVKAIISGDKWSLKNMEKWNNAVTLSKPLMNVSSPEKPHSPLLGMKTLRETDPKHNPTVFEQEHPEISAIVDIGSDTPSYDPADFQRMHYVKFKTESKVLPDDVTIARFLVIIDKLVAAQRPDQYIVVHCHYGQNRTGFLISCYLVERLGWTVHEALQSFEHSKEPGIKHQHFKNALYLRYGE